MDEREFCIAETKKHQDIVKGLILIVADELTERASKHDGSKLGDYELQGFVEYTPKLKNCTYGSDEYKGYLNAMKPFLDHHYKENRHHPEHFRRFTCNLCFKEYKPEAPDFCTVCGNTQFTEEPDMSQMNLIDLVEMICDWIAATKRHADGDIIKSIDINGERFVYGDRLAEIFKNTVKAIME